MKAPEFFSQFDGPLARLLRKHFAYSPPPDPWPKEVDIAVRSIAAVPLCLNCLCSQERHRSFCSYCHFPTGDFVALNPYLQIYCIGELFRQGVMGPPERRFGVWAFLAVYSFAEYTVFAPFYWFWLLRRAHGKPICVESRRELPAEEYTEFLFGPLDRHS